MPVVFSGSRSTLRLLGVLALSATSLVAACGRGEQDAQAKTAGAIRDDFGTLVEAPASPPARIVSLNPTTTEILFTIGAGSRVVGRTHWDEWPDSAKLVTDLGDGIRPNVEAVLAQRPDLVVLYASDDDRPAAEKLRAAGVRVAAFKVDRIADFRRVTLALGRLTGLEPRAATVVDSVTGTIERVRRETAKLPHPTVFMHAWDSPIITIGGGSFMSELVEAAGGRNVYADLAAPSPTVTMEDVLRRNPDVVLAGPIAAAELRTSPTWRALPAVRNGRILVYDTTIVARPSVTMGMAAVSLERLLHPGDSTAATKR